MERGVGMLVGGVLLCAVIALGVVTQYGGDEPSSREAADAASPESVSPVERSRATVRVADASTNETDGPDADTDADTADETYTLSGSVVTADGRALAGAVVRATPVAEWPGMIDAREPVTVVADEAGRFGTRDLTAGDWAFLVSAEGALDTYVATVRVRAETQIDLVLPRGGVIAGIVIDETTRAPVPDAHVRIMGSERQIGEARTDGAGRFQIALFDDLQRLAPFRISAPGYAPRPAPSSALRIDETRLGRHDVTLVAWRGHTLSGTVVGPDDPIANARVDAVTTVYDDDPSEWRSAMTNARGEFSIAGLHPDKIFDDFYVRVSAEGFVEEDAGHPEFAPPGQPYTQRIDPSRHGWSDHVLHMRRVLPLGECSISGRVLDDDEKPAGGVTVVTRQGERTVSTISAADGSFRLERVATEQQDGSVELAGEVDGEEIGAESVDTTHGAHVKDVRLFVWPSTPTERTRVRGVVRDLDGAPVGAARVVLISYSDEEKLIFGRRSPQAPPVSTRTAADGTFDAGVPADDLLFVAVEAPGFAPWSRGHLFDEDLEAITVELDVARDLTGVVVRAGTEAGIAGAHVTLVRHMPHDIRSSDDAARHFDARVVAVTDASGAFRLRGAVPGDEVRVLVPGLGVYEHYVEHPLPETLVIPCEPRAALRGRATFADATPSAFVSVRVHTSDPAEQREDARSIAHFAADATGAFHSDPLPSGRYWLAFRGGSPPVVPHVAGPFEPGGGENRIALVRGETLRGRVLRPDGEPGRGVVVNATPTDRSGPAGEARTTWNGWFAVEGLDDGSYALSVNVDGCLPCTVTGVTSQDEAVTLQLDEGLVVAGVIRHSDGSTFNFVELLAEPLEAEPGGEPAVGIRARSDVDGRFRISALTPGRWRIRFRSDTYSETLGTETVVVAGDESVELRTAPRPARSDD